MTFSLKLFPNETVQVIKIEMTVLAQYGPETANSPRCTRHSGREQTTLGPCRVLPDAIRPPSQGSLLCSVKGDKADKPKME